MWHWRYNTVVSDSTCP